MAALTRRLSSLLLRVMPPTCFSSVTRLEEATVSASTSVEHKRVRSSPSSNPPRPPPLARRRAMRLSTARPSAVDRRCPLFDHPAQKDRGSYNRNTEGQRLSCSPSTAGTQTTPFQASQLPAMTAARGRRLHAFSTVMPSAGDGNRRSGKLSTEDGSQEPPT